MTHRILAGAAVLGLAATAITASTQVGTAADDATRAGGVTLVFRLAARDAEDKYVDIGKKGDSPGDRYLGAITLRADGAIAGRLQHECTVLDNTYEGHLCHMAVVLEGGQLTFASGGVGKAIPGVGGRGDTFAVTGGTGDYQGATGQLEIIDDGARVTITLQP